MELQNFSGKELVSIYNHLAGKKIKKFESRAIGEKQVATVAKTMSDAAFAEAVEFSGYNERMRTPVKAPKAAKAPKAPKVAKAPKALVAKKKTSVAAKKPAANGANRSDAIAASWKNPKTAAKRAERTAVKASGTQYRSVREAFVVLDLPLEKHIGFRMDLKAAGELAFKHDGRTVTFRVVE